MGKRKARKESARYSDMRTKKGDEISDSAGIQEGAVSVLYSATADA